MTLDEELITSTTCPLEDLGLEPAGDEKNSHQPETPATLADTQADDLSIHHVPDGIGGSFTALPGGKKVPSHLVK
jgi:hypothetical protein